MGSWKFHDYVMVVEFYVTRNWKTILISLLSQRSLDVVSQTYLKKGKTTRIYELKTMIHNTKQKDLTVTTYYNTLKILWQELDLCQHFEMESTTNASMLVEL